ncbi:MAG: HAMP domain-containing protein [Chloroflexi bacterium]|nr:HAMP domain-containing protein [Chloroflexota bacterium]
MVGFGILFASSGQVRWLASYVLFLALVVMILVGSSRLISSFRHRRLETDPIIEAAGRVQDGDYSARVPETGSAEARLLARSFNQMSARLEATDAQRRSFMADVSHELRTPLTVIQGQLEAIRDGVYPADAEHLAPALDQVAVLERLVEDLRTLALSESGSLKLTRESVDVGTLVTEVVSAFEPTAQAAGVTLSVTVTPAVPRAWLDPARIGSVVRNLVANALRYTPAGGGVTIEVAATDTEQVVVSVRDTGRGIDPALLGTVFERFSRSPDSTGSGLGLAIARALVEAHGGTITAASEPGSGTTMTVRLPVGSI